MMNKVIASLLFCSLGAALFSVYEYNGSTTAAVTLSGAVVSTPHLSIEKKYKRKDCPVCKGKGWYISGDDITKVPCGYCEPDEEGSTITHPPVIIKQEKPPMRVFKR